MTGELIRRLQEAEPFLWLNPDYDPEQLSNSKLVGKEGVIEAEERLKRFAPLIRILFPETADRNGSIESELVPLPTLQEKWQIRGALLLKSDHELPIAGSVKASGGIHEVLRFTEEVARKRDLLGEDYSMLASPEARRIFSDYTVQVGSTGNLGLSIGIMAAALGFRVIVHMSSDAKNWKKRLLRDHGVLVREYAGPYEEAVTAGRKEAEADPFSYFVDDEHSLDLFYGYAVVAKRIRRQLDLFWDGCSPLFFYLPCGVGGAPGGIAYGLKEFLGHHAHIFFVEPVQAPCMLLGMATGLHEKIAVRDVGLSGMTDADGLAVGRPSGFVGKVMQRILSGICTVSDQELWKYLKMLWEEEHIFLEPSACAGFEGLFHVWQKSGGEAYLGKYCPGSLQTHPLHIVWATGGGLVPEDIRKNWLSEGGIS